MNLKNVDMNLLVTFDALVSELSVSRAADKLGVTQSALSHALKRLRVMFGDPLLYRGPRGMEPTERALSLMQLRQLAPVGGGSSGGSGGGSGGGGGGGGSESARKTTLN